MILHEIVSKLFEYIDFQEIKPSTQEIDIVIPIVRKDIAILPLCIEGIKSCVSHPVKAIYIVAPDDEEIISFCKANGIKYIDERSVLGFGPKEVNLIVTNSAGITENRSGWLFQQLLKLSGKVGTCDNYLCIDSDHILMRPHTFIDENERPVFYLTSQKHKAYYENLSRLVDLDKYTFLGYVAHKMIFNRQNLEKLHQMIKQKNGKDWMQAIIDGYDRTQGSGFSEFELYGNFVSEKKFLPWKQKKLRYKDLSDYQTLKRRYGKRFRSVTFPEYLNRNN